MAELVDRFEQANICLDDSRGEPAAREGTCSREELVDLKARLKAYEKTQMASQNHQQELQHPLDAAHSKRQEKPVAYYHRLRQAYFCQTNSPGMEKEGNLKSLFVQNLHPTTSHHLGQHLAARPDTHRAFTERCVTLP